jgi:plastocyanin
VRWALLAAAVLALGPPAAAGSITGTLTLLDKGGRRAADVADAVVYVDGLRGAVKPVRTSVVMKGKQFHPHVAVVPVGGTVEFPNEDSIFHNVFSVSGENRFDLDLYKRPQTGAWTFRHAGVVRVYCNIHPQMAAVVLVRDNSHYARVDAGGTFALPDVPAGTYRLKAWHPRGGETEAQVVVPAQGAVTVQLSLDASNFKRLAHKNKFGKDYARGERY